MIETQTPPPAKRSWFLAVSIVAFVIVAGFSVYFQFALKGLNDQIQKLETRKSELNKPLANTSTLNALTAAVAIKGELQKIESSQLKWSKLMEKIDATIPKMKDSKDPIIIFKSYNGDANGTVNVNASTRSGSLDPFSDTALLIRAFAADPAFQNVFVPTITKSVGSDGASVLNFTLSFTYQQPNF